MKKRRHSRPRSRPLPARVEAPPEQRFLVAVSDSQPTKNWLVRKPTLLRLIICLAVVSIITTVFLATRSYYATEPAVDEDGVFTKIIMDNVKGPAYAFIARISDKDHYIYIAHPGIMYEVLKAPGFVLNMNRHKGDPIDQRTILSLRIAMSMFQYAVVVLLLFALLPRIEDRSARPQDWLPFGACASLILAWTMAPQSIIWSLDLQTDDTVGVLMVGALAIAALFASMKPDSKLRLGLVFLAAAFCGCGKTTWTLCVLAAVCVSGFCSVVLRFIPKNKLRVVEAAGIYTMIAAGTIIGNFISYRFDPENYRRSLDRLVGFAGSQTGSVVTNVALKLPDIWPILALLIVAFALLASDAFGKDSAADPGSLFLFFLAFFLTAHLIFGSWYFPRYFAPGSVAALISVTSLLRRRISRSLLWGIVALSAVGTILAVQVIHRRAVAVRNGMITQKRNLIDADNTRRIDYARVHNCVPLLGIAYAVEHPNEEFVASSGGLEGARQLLPFFGRTPCDPTVLYKK
jgi:hypothetical protein